MQQLLFCIDVIHVFCHKTINKLETKLKSSNALCNTETEDEFSGLKHLNLYLFRRAMDDRTPKFSKDLHVVLLFAHRSLGLNIILYWFEKLGHHHAV